jgi:hypothetical protein
LGTYPGWELNACLVNTIAKINKINALKKEII